MIESTNVKVGDRLYVPNEVKPYTVRARDERYIIATKPFNLRHTVLYFIIDLIKDVRGPDNMIFCFGYETDEAINKRLQELSNGDIEVSKRHCVKTAMVDRIG